MARAFHKLTRLAMRKLPPGGKIMEHGITFERLSHGDGVFTVNVMVDGQRIHRVIGRESDGTTRTQAEGFIEKVRRDAREGRLNLPKGRKIALGFREAATKYLQRLQEGDGKDLTAKRRRLNLHLIAFFGDLPLSKISSLDIERPTLSRCSKRKNHLSSAECLAASIGFRGGLTHGTEARRTPRSLRGDRCGDQRLRAD
jgi:hypothetical protein